MSRGAAPALVLLASLLVTTCVAGARDLQEPKGESGARALRPVSSEFATVALQRLVQCRRR